MIRWPEHPGSAALHLIRHGETAWSLSGRHTGKTEVSLTQPGEGDSRRLLARLRGVGFHRVFTSPRRRAHRTCELAGLGAVARIEPDLAEWDYGDYEGLTTAEIHERHPRWNIFRDGCPTGESPEQVAARADRLLARLRPLEGNVALFTHGHFGRVLGARWIGLPVRDARRFLLSSASLSLLGYEHGRADQPAVVLWNDVSHTASPVAGAPPGAAGIEQPPSPRT
jgi:probable phosphoglycerate mutase